MFRVGTSVAAWSGRGTRTRFFYSNLRLTIPL
jgi:hypothetical protein